MNKILIISLSMFLMLVGSGCWDIRDATNRAFVTAIGLDKPEQGKTVKSKVTFVIIDPVKLSGKSREPATIIKTVEADSVGQAVELCQTIIPRTLTFSHLRVVVIGERFATEDIRDSVDFFEKHPDIALRLRLLFVQDNDASDLLRVRPEFDSSISDALVAMTQLDQALSLVRTNRFYDFINDLRETDGTAFGNRVLLSKDDKTVIRSGGAVFDNWKLAGWLGDTETQAANWILEDKNSRIIGRMGNGTYSYLVGNKSSRIIPKLENGKLKLIVKVTAVGKVSQEQGRNIDLSNPANINKLENVFSSTIARQVQKAVYKSQKEFGIDYLEFGRTFEQYHPKAFVNVNENSPLLTEKIPHPELAYSMGKNFVMSESFPQQLFSCV